MNKKGILPFMLAMASLKVDESIKIKDDKKKLKKSKASKKKLKKKKIAKASRKKNRK